MTKSHATARTATKLGALLVAAGPGLVAEHALISLLALNGLRALRSHRRRHRASGPGARAPTRTITRKGGKVVTIPLAPAARAIDLAVGERTGGPDS